MSLASRIVVGIFGVFWLGQVYAIHVGFQGGELLRSLEAVIEQHEKLSLTDFFHIDNQKIFSDDIFSLKFTDLEKPRNQLVVEVVGSGGIDCVITPEHTLRLLGLLGKKQVIQVIEHPVQMEKGYCRENDLFVYTGRFTVFKLEREVLKEHIERFFKTPKPGEKFPPSSPTSVFGGISEVRLRNVFQSFMGEKLTFNDVCTVAPLTKVVPMGRIFDEFQRGILVQVVEQGIKRSAATTTRVPICPLYAQFFLNPSLLDEWQKFETKLSKVRSKKIKIQHLIEAENESYNTIPLINSYWLKTQEGLPCRVSVGSKMQSLKYAKFAYLILRQGEEESEDNLCKVGELVIDSSKVPRKFF